METEVRGDPDKIHLDEYKRELSRVDKMNPLVHYRDEPGLANSPENARLYRMDSIKRRILDMNTRLSHK